MIWKCEKKDEGMLLEFLYRKPVYHTFLIADIQSYGFDKDYQKVYIQSDGGECQGVLLQYYNNFLIAGEQTCLDYETILTLLDEQITTIMGEVGIISEMNKHLRQSTAFTRKTLFTLPKLVAEMPADQTRIAGLEHVAEIHEFLMSFPEMRPLYKESGMIYNRIRSGEGMHVFIRDDGRIIAHGNSAGGTDKTSMLGGICVAEEYRRRGYGRQVVYRIAQKLQEQKKIPCVFSEEGEGSDFFRSLMFEKYGEWGSIQRQEG